MPAHPAYAVVLAAGYAEKPESRVNRTPMEDGFTKQSTFASRALVQRPYRALLKSNADYTTFRTWFYDTIGRVGWFDYTDPRDGVVKLARFVEGKLDFTATRSSLDRWIAEGAIETWGH